MLQVYAFVVLINIILLFLCKEFSISNTCNMMDKIFYFTQNIGLDGDGNNTYITVIWYVLCPLLNLVMLFVLFYLVFSDYERFKKFIDYMEDEDE